MHETCLRYVACLDYLLPQVCSDTNLHSETNPMLKTLFLKHHHVRLNQEQMGTDMVKFTMSVIANQIMSTFSPHTFNSPACAPQDLILFWHWLQVAACMKLCMSQRSMCLRATNRAARQAHANHRLCAHNTSIIPRHIYWAHMCRRLLRT